MRTAVLFANRLALLRHETGLTQEELAIAISEIEERKKAYSILAVSGWETGEKCPPLVTFIALCDFFGVSADYLLGRSKAGNKDIVTSHPDNYDGDDMPSYHVAFSELPKHDGEPIYVVFIDKKNRDQWGIVDWSKKRIAFSESFLRITRET